MVNQHEVAILFSVISFFFIFQASSKNDHLGGRYGLHFCETTFLETAELCFKKQRGYMIFSALKVLG